MMLKIQVWLCTGTKMWRN